MNCSETKSRRYGLLSLCLAILCVLLLAVGLLTRAAAAEPAPVAADHSESYACEVSGKSYILYYSITGDRACVTDFSKDHASTVAVRIPDSITVNGTVCTVTAIADEAFAGAGINRVTLAAGITELGARAFMGCSELVTVELNEALSEIGEGAFQKCSKLTAVSIPAGVTEIKANTFADCTSLTSLSLGNVKSIGARAFYDVGVKTLKLNDALETVGAEAFRDADLRVVRTGRNLRYVGDAAFSCEELYYFDVRFARPAESWGENIFKASMDASGNPVYDRTVLYRPEALEGWSTCYGLNPDGRWESEADFAGWHFKDTITLDFEGDLSDILQGLNAEPDLSRLVYDASGIAYVLTTLPTDENGDNVADGSIYVAVVWGYDGARNLNDRTALEIPAVVWYDEEAFRTFVVSFETVSHAEELRSLTLPSLQSIQTQTFSALPALETIYLKSLTFDYNGQETWLLVGEDTAPIEEAWTDKRVILAENTQHSGASHIYSCFELDGYSYDKQGIYYQIDKTLGVVIVGDLSRGDDERANTSRYSGSGYYSGEAGHAVIPDYVSDGEHCYPVVGLGRYAFYNCNSLSKLTLGAHVGQEVTDADGNPWIDSAIGDCALRNCSILSAFSVSAKNRCYVTDGGILYACSVDPLGVLRATKIVKATNSVTLFGRGNEGYFETVTAVENYAFAGCTGLTSFDFGKIVTVGAHAFENTGLAEVILNSEEIRVMEYAFANNSFLRRVHLGAGTALGRFVFQFCTAIEAFSSDSEKYIVDDRGALFEKREGYAVLLQYPAANREHPSYGINYFTKGGVADPALPIREIEAYALYGSPLESIAIGDEVLYVGKAAFESSAKLREVTVGKGVLAIGIEIAGETWWTEHFATGFAPDTVAIYEREVFDRCPVLAQIRVDAENAYYCSDTNGILYNVDKTTLLVYAEGITRITFTAPITLTSIGIEAFENNVHLQRLILPEGIVEVGAKAFNGCTRLGMIYFRSLTAPKLGEQVFNSTGALNGNEGLTVYCIPEPGEWVDVRTEMWSAYAPMIKKYVAIQEVPEQALPTPQTYLVYVIDTDGNTLPGTIVEYGYISTIDPTKTVWKVLTVNDEGYAVLTMPEASQLFGGNAISLRVTDPKEIFFGFEALESFTPDFESDYSYITLRSVPGASGLLCQGKDIDTGRVSVNTAGLDEGDVIKLSVRAHWDQVDVFRSIRILQREYFADGTKETLLASTDIAAAGGVFRFELDPSLVPSTEGVDYGFFVELTVLSPAGEPVTVEQPLNVDLFYYEMGVDALENFKFNNEIEFELDPSIPLIGGLEFEAQIFQTFIMPSVAYDRDKIYVGINMGSFFDDVFGESSDGNREYYKELREEFMERVEQLKNEHKEINKDATVKVELTGLVELEKRSLNKNCVITRSEIVGTVTFEFEVGKTVVAWVIPLRFEFEFEAEGTYRMIMDWEGYKQDGEFWGNREFELEFNIHGEVRAGLGCSFASIGVYGCADLDVVIAFAKEISGISGTFSLDAGAYIKLDLVFFKVIKHFSANELFGGTGPLLSVPFECTFWNKTVDGVSTWSLKGDSANRRFATFSEAISYSLGTVDTTFRPSDPTYEEYVGTESKIVSYKGVNYRFYIDNVYLNKNVVNNGVTYDEYNFLKLVYSNQLEDGSWSTPKIVNRDLYNEVGFDLCVDENGIHVVYRRASDKVSAENSAQYVEMTEVWQVSFSGNRFSAPVKLSTTASYKLDTKIQSINGVLFVTWSENADNNIFGMSPDNTQSADGSYTIYPTDKNAICIAILRNGAWESLRVLDELPLIADFAVCPIGDTAKLLVLLDADCDMISTDDRQLFCVDLSADTLTPVRITPTDANGDPIAPTLDEEGILIGQAITSVRYENGVLYLAANGTLYTCTPTAEDEWSTEAICEGIGNDYRFIYRADGSLFGIGYLVQRGELAADLVVIPYVEGRFASPMTLISHGENGIIEFFSTYAYGDRIQVLYTLSTARGEFRTYAVHEREVKLPDDLILENVSCDSDRVKANTAFDLHLTLKNSSLRPLTSLTVNLRDPASGELIRSVELTGLMLMPGSTETLTVSLTLESFLFSYRVEVVETDAAYTDETTENNVCQFSIVYPDLSVSAKHVEIAGVQYLLVLVQNLGELPTAGYTLYVESGIVDVTRPLSERKLLYTVKNDKGLEPGKYVYYTVELNKVYFTEEYVTFSVSTDEAENNTFNNTVIMSMRKHEDVSYGTSYKLTYYLDDQVYYTAEYRPGQLIDPTLVGVMEREGYTFSGWLGEKSVMPDHDVEVFGFFRINTYFVHYYVDGVLTHSDAVEYGKRITVRDHKIKTGHSFSGWVIANEDGSVTDFVGGMMPAHDLTVEGDFTRNTYTVTYYVDNKAVKTQSYLYGDAVNAYVYPLPEGYQISAWSHTYLVMPNYDVAVYAVTQPRSYQLIYQVTNPDGAVRTVYQTSVPYNTAIPYYDFIPMLGYGFGGWTDANGNAITKENKPNMPAADLTIKGNETRLLYTLTYVVNGETVKSETHFYGDALTPLEYSKDGYTFSGWESLPTTMPACHLTVYGGQKQNLYRVQFYVDGSMLREAYYPKDAVIDLSVRPAREGYTFGGWGTVHDEEGREITLTDGKMPMQNIRISGSFTPNSYRLVYYVDSKPVKELSLTYGSSITAHAYTPAEGYAFSGWRDLPETMPAHDVAVYGTTSLRVFVLRYYVDQKLVLEQQLAYGSAIEAYTYQPAPGYRVGAWSSVPATMPARDVELHAVTEPIAYDLRYYVDGELQKTESYRYGARIEPFAYLPETGRSFLGWGTLPETMPAQSLDVYGSTAIKTYRLDYYVDGELLYSDLYEYDALIEKRPEPTREGHSFSGWGDVARRMPDRDLRLDATFARNQYSVFYYVDGELIDTDSFDFGAKLTPRAAEVAEGYTFSGWGALPETMPAMDLTLEASFAVNTYKVRYYINDVLYKTEEITYGQTLAPELPEVNGQRVVGWEIAGAALEQDYRMPSGDVRADAKLEQIKKPFVKTMGFAIGVSIAGAALVTGGTFLGVEFLLRKKRRSLTDWMD